MGYYWKIKEADNLWWNIYPIAMGAVGPVATVYNLEQAIEICNKHNDSVFADTHEFCQACEIGDKVFVNDYTLSGWGLIEEIDREKETLIVKLDQYYNSNLFNFCQVHGFRKTYNKSMELTEESRATSERLE